MSRERDSAIARYNEGIKVFFVITPKETMDDVKHTNEFIRVKLPSLQVIEQKIKELPLPLPEDIVKRGEELAKRREKDTLALELWPLHVDVNKLPEDSKSHWFTYAATRFMYEILISTYLPQVARPDIIDFKVSIDTKRLTTILKPEGDTQPETFVEYIRSWFNHLIQNDDKIINITPGNSEGKIVRRVLCFGFRTIFYIPEHRGDNEVCESGHQILIILEKHPRDPNKVYLFIVDNLHKILNYRYRINDMIVSTCTKLLRDMIPQITLERCIEIPNVLPSSEDLGSCMSLSFRAMIYCSFLRHPYEKIMNLDNVDNENERIFKLMYLQLERMRLSILNNPLLWKSTHEYSLYYLHSEVPTNVHDIHNINTPHLWLIPFVVIKKAIDMQRADNMIKLLRSNGDLGKLKKYVFNLSMDIDIDTDTIHTVRRTDPSLLGQPCKIMSEFPRLYI
jgi:hypothetical protein